MMVMRVPAHPDDDPARPPLRVGETAQRRVPNLTGRHTIRVHAMHWQALGDITVTDARREGYRSRDPLAEMRADWIGRHDRPWLAKHAGATASDLSKRWHARHAGLGSWVISFVLVDDTRCLRRQAGDNPLLQGTDGQYVGAASMSIDPECEAVDRLLTDRFAADAQMVRAAAKAAAVGRRQERARRRIEAARARS